MVLKIIPKNIFTKVCLLLIFIVFSCKSEEQIKNSDMESDFKSIPEDTKLSVYWYWIDGKISKDGVIKDLESMADVGIDRAYIGNIGLNEDKHSQAKKDTINCVKLFSDEWWEITRQALKTADSLNIEIGIFNSPGWSQSGGPWIEPEESMRYLTTESYQVKGPEKVKKSLKEPDSNFQRTAVLAFPTPKGGSEEMRDLKKLKTTPSFKNSNQLIDRDLSTGTFFPDLSKSDTSYTIDLTFNRKFKARSLLVYPADTPVKADVELQVEKEGDYKTIKDFVFDRSNMDKNVGFLPYAPAVISIPKTRGDRFRLVFSQVSSDAALSEIKLSSQAYLDRYVEKQLGKLHQTPLPMWDAYRWDTQKETYPNPYKIQADSVQDITKHLSGNNVLNWEVPEGDWTILDLGMIPTGVTNAPAAPEGTGLEVDKMSKAHLKKHFNSFIGNILSNIPKEDRKAFKYVVADSYETGAQTWTDDFRKKFEKRYSYDPLIYLPVLDGNIVGNADKSDRFLWDLRRLIADEIANEYVGGLRELSHEHGLKNWLENYGHWGFPAEFLQYGGEADEVAGEFWTEGELGDIELKAASSSANIYGKNEVFAESFTSGASPFSRHPGNLKKRGDWAFTEGINSNLLHLFISQPSSYPKPGMNAPFGTEFNRNNTWFKMGKSFFDYLRRDNFMLQQGRPVRDVAYFIGESAPVMAGIKEPELPNGYSYDYINAEVIKNRVSVEDGDLVLPNGISYKLVVLPPEKSIRPDVLKRIRSLVEKGATILGPEPEVSPSLQNYPRADKVVKKLAKDLWQNSANKDIKMVEYGKGNVLRGMDMTEAFHFLATEPDMNFESSLPVLFTHRKRDNGTDIYFISNQSDSIIEFNPSFRVTGKRPEWWNAVEGSTRKLHQFNQSKESTTVPLTLDSYESGFVVFRNETEKEEGHGKNFPISEELKVLNSPWEVTFESPNKKVSDSLVFDSLQSWTDNSKDVIKYFSGTATYHTSFEIIDIPDNETVFLDLGEVGIMAQVFLNDKKVGTVWTAPLKVNITKALQEGINKLTIKVVNTWENRLIGDSKLPQEEQKSKTEVNPYAPEDTLKPSGLIGPVTIQSTDYGER